ncbi:MAG: hypothetical protein AAFW60_10935, partial [Pseudomonadota bacterium]
PPIPGPSVPAGPSVSSGAAPLPPVAAPVSHPAHPSSATPVAPSTGPASAVLPAAAGLLDPHGREKLQSALYELTECRRILFDALRAGEE